MANGNGTVPAPTNIWASLVGEGLEGWLSYLNRPRDPIVTNVQPWGSSASDTQVAVLNAQLQAQQQTQRMLMLLAGGALVIYLLMK